MMRVLERCRSPENTLKTRHIYLIYLQCYFVTIATILGTGVLGLPVKLSRSGIYPFLVTFVIAFLMQALLIVFVTELLQKLEAKLISNSQSGSSSERLPLNDVDVEQEEQDSNDSESTGNTVAQQDNIPHSNLHLLGVYFLPTGLRQAFDILILFHFISLLISYALAGSEAFASLLNVDYIYLITPFVCILTLAIVFCFALIQPIVSLLTFLKGSLLVATVAVTFFVGSTVKLNIVNDFTYLGEPFLIETVALGGTINLMPLLYNKIRPVKNEIIGYRWSCILGLVTCTLLNIVWCWAVLDIVPQMNTCYVDPVNRTFLQTMDCVNNKSLESAELNGEISTIPLTNIIHEKYPQYSWVAILIQCFIMLSITVSYLTLGAALQHTLTGWIDTVCNEDCITKLFGSYIQTRSDKCFNIKCALRMAVTFLTFGLVYTIAMINPKSFISLLEIVASLMLNTEAGFFIFVMLLVANNKHNRYLRIPDKISEFVYKLKILLPIYFGFAVIYDLFLIIYHRSRPGQPLPWETGERPEQFSIYSNLSSILQSTRNISSSSAAPKVL